MRHCVRKNIRKPEVEKGLIRALINHKQIKTTLGRAKKIRPAFEKLITKGIKILNTEEGVSSLSKMRLLTADLGSYKLAQKLVSEVCPLVKERMGGYTRILKLSKVRAGDSAETAIISLVYQN